MGFDWASATAGLHQLVARFGERIPYIGLALAVFVVFYAVCTTVTWWCYLRSRVLVTRVPSLAHAGV